MNKINTFKYTNNIRRVKMARSRFVKIFGATPKVMVIDYLLDNTLLDFHKSDIAECTGISRSTLDTFFEELVRNRFIVPSRTIGRARMYMVNKRNPTVRKLLQVDRSLSREKAIIAKTS
jgi:hypothetical protein